MPYNGQDIFKSFRTLQVYDFKYLRPSMLNVIYTGRIQSNYQTVPCFKVVNKYK